MIKVLVLSDKDGECEKEFSRGDHWTYKGAFVEIQDREGKVIASFNSGRLLSTDKLPVNGLALLIGDLPVMIRLLAPYWLLVSEYDNRALRFSL